MRKLSSLATCVALLALVGCSSHASSSGNASPSASHGRIVVVTTFSTLNSFVNGVGGRLVHVSSIVPVGASPETFQPTPQDVALLSRAKLVVE
ncbi:MAG TPA: zinc ABC transporter substrate-binding protein, partial [Candidatus Dormibacteraeota bacterium]|nr:zinc ABC transporter substrate-binding protein [Candidatus Dormibacteraeota bacterium]